MTVYIPCKCGHYEWDHRDPVTHFNSCEECSSKRTVHASWNWPSEAITFREEPEFICSGYIPMDGLEYIEWLEKQKIKA